MYNSVLIVDDDPIYTNLVSRGLQWVGASHVQTANSIALALRLIDECAAPDLVVTEIVVAREACYPLLRHCATKQVRPAIVAMTGKASKAQVFRLSAYDVCGFLEKPFPPDALRRAILPPDAALRERGAWTSSPRSTSTAAMPDGVVERYRNAYQLSNAETDVLRYWCMGLAGPAIAGEKGTSLNTVKTQIRSILRKTGAPSMRQLATQMRVKMVRLEVGQELGTKPANVLTREG